MVNPEGTRPDDADEPGPLTPGNSYTFEVDAEPGDRLREDNQALRRDLTHSRLVDDVMQSLGEDPEDGEAE